MSNAHLLFLPALHPKSLFDGFRSLACRCIAPRAFHIRIAQVLKPDLVTYWTKHEVKVALLHARVIKQLVSELERTLVVQRVSEDIATGVPDTDDERDAGDVGR